jgi:uncharacterized protein YndB with AHSA1/START domain
MSSMATTGTSILTSVVVDTPQDRAFHVFTDEIGTWWDPEHHLLPEGTTLQEMIFEPRVGGHVYDIASDGSECRWSRVLAYDPPERVVFSWDINLQWEIESDLDRTSEVEVRFIAEAPDRTRVELEHRHLDRHGEGWEQLRAAVGADDGWGSGLRRYADAATAR